MIVKKIKSKKISRPKDRQIADLVDYIRQPHSINSKEKIEHSGGRNFLSETHSGQRLEMIALATESVHSKMPVSHFIYSWRENEQPTAAQVDELVDIFLEHMGLTGHQVIYGLHYNTDNYHLHLAVNRMNPDTMKVVDPNNGFDIEAAHQVLALVEHRQGWTPEKNARYTVNESGKVIFRPKPEKITPKPRQEAIDFECATGEKSAQRIAQERGHAIISNARTWAELHTKLAANGLRFTKKGSGAIIFVGDIAVKASSVDRAFSLKNLEKRLGAFVLGEYPDEPSAPVTPEPVSEISLDAWRQYQNEREIARSLPMPEKDDKPLADLQARHREERRVKLGNIRRKYAEPVLTKFFRYALKMQHTKELRRLRRELSVERRAVRKTAKPRLPRFEEWLRAKGMNRQAEQWRYRHTLEAAPENLREAPSLPTEQKYDPAKAYAAHRQAMLKMMPDTEPSRLDAYIALQMREKGYTREVVRETILQCAPKAQERQPDQKERDWQRYAERATAYAFGMAGDVKLAQAAAYLEEKRKEGEQIGQREAEERREKPQTEAPRMRMR
ncbi:MAG: relaxase/mobilization nuclease domain-containing protein [Desulfovibrio sp.]|jgi:hypothetical protein|nr:relaxase/mobilization nuclease domain-containing protein [Desulfovibrio sp.]